MKGKKLKDEEVYKLLTFADLDSSFFNKPGSELSVGQAQRVSLARTLANEPEVIQVHYASYISHRLVFYSMHKWPLYDEVVLLFSLIEWWFVGCYGLMFLVWQTYVIYEFFDVCLYYPCSKLHRT